MNTHEPQSVVIMDFPKFREEIDKYIATHVASEVEKAKIKKNLYLTTREVCEIFRVTPQTLIEHTSVSNYKLIYQNLKQKIVAENPNLSEIRIEQEISYTLRKIGLSHAEIGNLVGCTRENIYNSIKRVEMDLYREKINPNSKREVHNRLEVMTEYLQ